MLQATRWEGARMFAPMVGWVAGTGVVILIVVLVVVLLGYCSSSSSSRRGISTTSGDRTLRAVLVGMLRESEGS
jgi:hypothetical protein